MYCTAAIRETSAVGVRDDAGCPSAWHVVHAGAEFNVPELVFRADFARGFVPV